MNIHKRPFSSFGVDFVIFFLIGVLLLGLLLGVLSSFSM